MCQDVFGHVASLVPSVHTIGHPQKKGISPGQIQKRIKHVKGVSCVNLCHSVPNVQSAPTVVDTLSVGGRLHSFWQKWKELGVNQRVVSIIKEGYTLPFKLRPPLTRGRFHEKSQTEPDSRLSQSLKSETFVPAEFFSNGFHKGWIS